MKLGELKHIMSKPTQVECYTLNKPGHPETVYRGSAGYISEEILGYDVVHFHITDGGLEIQLSKPGEKPADLVSRKIFDDTFGSAATFNL